MSRDVFISRFSPSRTDPEDLEAITVQRETLLVEAVECVRQSVLTENKHHVLFVGPRGAGKTHIIALVYHRLSRIDDLTERLRIAWLNEDETSDSFVSLLLRIHRALSTKYPGEFPAESVEPILDLYDQDTAAEAASRLLLEQLGGRVLLVLVENLDSLFRDLGESEQKRWRALIQNQPRFCTIATAQRLFHGVSQRDAPFFGFFRVEHLRPFLVGDATELLSKIAHLRKDDELAKFLESPRGRSRIRALHHLTGGNQRLFIILSDFINRGSLDSLVGPFEELVDEQLTPYYQERLRWLPALQRRIVEFLCSAPKPVPVKIIARHLFATPPTVSSQLKCLREIGYLVSHKRGRESLYELAEPLMRLSYQVKETRGREPLRLLVDFLRVWYDHNELAQRMSSTESDALVTREYLTEALSLAKTEGDLRLQFLREDTEGFDIESCGKEELEALRDLMDESGEPEDRLRFGKALGWRGLHAEALDIFSPVLEDNRATADQIATALFNRGVTHDHLGNTDAAIADYVAVVQMDGTPSDLIAMALVNCGLAHSQLGNTDAAITDYTTVVQMEDAPSNSIAMALLNRGVLHSRLGNTNAAVTDYTAVAQMEDARNNSIAMALLNRGVLHSRLGNTDAAITDYTAVVQTDGAPADLIAKALTNRGGTHGQLGDTNAEIADYTAAAETEDAPTDHICQALFNRGLAHGRLGNIDAAIADYTAAAQMEGAPSDQIAQALFNRGATYGQLGNTDAAIADYTAVAQMKGAPSDQIAKALINRGATHGELGDTDAEIADHTAVAQMEGAPSSLVAMALFNRGNTRIRLGDTDAAIADYTAAAQMEETPNDQIAKALFNRGIAHGELGNSDAEVADYTAVVEMAGAPQDVVSRAQFHWAGAAMRQGEWTEAFRRLRLGFSSVREQRPDYVGYIPGFINAILNAGHTRDAWAPKIDQLLEIYSENEALTDLAAGLGGSIASLPRAALSPAGLSAWHAAWAGRADMYPKLELPARLLRTGIDFFASGQNETVLLDLPDEERRILARVLGLD